MVAVSGPSFAYSGNPVHQTELWPDAFYLDLLIHIYRAFLF